jgi:sugar phosphate isomerase/epimerase
MKLCYALRRGVWYPSQRDAFGEMPPREHRRPYLRAVKGLGFDGVEIPTSAVASVSEAAARELRAELEDAGLPAVCVRAGGPIAHPRDGAATLSRVLETVRFAAWVGASVVNVTCVTPPANPGAPGAAHIGEPVSQGASRYASEADYVATAHAYREVGRLAGDLGLDVSIEIHQGSIADNSWSGLHLTDLIDLPNFGVNPDLGNIFWQYDAPEETCESAIVALAPRAKYWHCKNLKKVAIPDLNKAVFLRVALPDGDIDYRFAVAAMLDAKYEGYMSIEGAREGDQLTIAARSAEYARQIIAGLS